jgi:hypothetical protein
VGLFDEVRCEFPLPDPAHQGLVFQTKDLESMMVEKQTEAGLEPAPYPRRPTPEQFSAHTPEKLELLDGHVPGEEKLLLLLLTTMGLRRAVELVGPKLWRSAAAPTRWSVSRRKELRAR